jgi:hypothetical protein
MLRSIGTRSSAIAHTDLSGEDFAAMLDRAIERSGMGLAVRQIEHQRDEAGPAPRPEIHSPASQRQGKA